MEPEIPEAPQGVTSGGPSRRSPNLALIVIIVLACIVAAFLFLRPPRKTGAEESKTPAPGAAPAGSPKGVVAVLVKLSPEAALIADRYNCLCGRCQDTLGKCTCAHDDVGDEMKATLNRIVAEKKSLAEIDAAMVEKYGSAVLASPPPSAGE